MKIIDAVDFSAYENEFPEQANVIPAFAFSEVVIDYFNGRLGKQGLPLPWSKTHGKISLRPGEVSVWAGINGSGKSLLLNQIMLQAMSQGETACIASMEMKPHITMARMTRQASGSNIPTEEFIRAFHSWTDGKLWLYDQQGVVDAKRIIAVMRYCQAGLQHEGKKISVNHFVIDSLMKCGIGVDDYNRQKSFVDQLCAHARDFGVHVHLVAHERKGESSRKMGDKFSVKGASEIIDQVDNAFIFWRNKDKEDEAHKPTPSIDVMQEPDCILRCDKQRHGEWEGKILLWYHAASMQYVAADGHRPIQFVRDNESNAERAAIQGEAA